MRGSLNAKRGLPLLLLFVILFYFYGLGVLPLVGPDEPRYAQVAREMFSRGDLITPTLANHTWFEKPVLLYWLMELSFSLFGISEASARLGPAVCGVLTILAVYWLGRRVERHLTREGLNHFAAISALLLATMFGLIVFSRAASFDVVLTMTLTWCLCFLLVACLVDRSSQRHWYLAGFYFCIGLSLLAKGLVGIVLPAGIILTFVLLRRSVPQREVLRSIWWGLPLTLLTAAIWYGPVIARHGWVFMDQFFVQHHFQRYLSDKYHHPQPFYFYIAILFALALPWLGIVVHSLVALRNVRFRSAAVQDVVLTFAMAWLIAPVVFFSVSRSKLPGYILPVLPALALIGGFQLTRLLSDRYRSSATIRVTGLLFLLFAICLIVYAKTSGQIGLTASLWIAAPGTIAGLITLLSSNRMRSLASLFAAVPISFVLALNSGAAIASKHSTRDLLEQAAAAGFASKPVYQLHEIDRTAEFYAAGRLVYDSSGQPLKLEGASELLQESKRRGEWILVLVPNEYAEQVTSLQAAEVKRLSDNGQIVLLAVKAS